MLIVHTPLFYHPLWNPLEYLIFWQNITNTATLPVLPRVQLNQFILLIMASQESNTTCETLPESGILTESEPDKLSEIPTISFDTTRDQCIAIKTALLFKVPWSKIRQELYVTNRQIQYANCYRTTPQKKKKYGGKPKLSTPERRALEAWLLESPSRRYIPWKQIPLCAPEFSDLGEHVIYTAMKSLGYCWRLQKEKASQLTLKSCVRG
jgi:hypothetical protein